MRTFVLKLGTLLLLITPAFASVHYVSQTLKPTAKLVYFPVRKSTFVVTHPVKTAKGIGKGTAAAVKTVF